MSIPNKAANAGVHGSSGFEFQKHCALYILFDKYYDIKRKKFFICLEHHDDFLFCYQTNDGLVSSIDAYQAKKSSGEWKQGADIYEILKKMTVVGISLKNDNMQKLDSYTHNLEFVTNNSINLNNSKRGKGRKSTIINETTSRLKLIDLNEEIASVIKDEVQKLLGQNSEGFGELDNVSMAYIDLPKKYKHQKDCLVGLFNGIFGDTVSDHRAAVEALLLLFREAENTLNSGNTVKLMDESKRVSSERINKALDIITTKNMAFNLWRAEEKEACRKLGIVISEKRKFESDFINSIDRFKDKQQVEHQKIFSFVNNNKNLLNDFTDELDCIQFLYEDFLSKANSQLSELSVKAAIFAAYIEVGEELWK
ncbi:dsDNA nuclease domain-containing protein [Bacillus wiedmannii]|uniref:dsDNA nuclease domain-containing protein n=1 Tax=Bacillus wiedmannii TaxID=1890302 RepID=UPI002E20E484|nr:dsDNA nuclease domain-containing protein [Bacillus wiedmannii]